MTASLIDVVVPQVGEATAEVTLVRWLKREGDQVAKGEPLFELDVDKYVVEIQSFESGTLAEILVSEGSAVLPLQLVARLAAGKARSGEGEPRAEVPAGEAEEATLAPTRVPASPKARRIADELGIDIAGLVGSGPGGLVTAKDVGDAARASDRGAAELPDGLRPLSKHRRSEASRTQASKREIPHFYLLADAEMSEAQRLRAHCTEELDWERAPSFTDIVVGACARALESCPEVNVSFTDGGLVPRRSVNIGLAVGTSEGLVVPVLSDASRLDLQGISARMRALATRARENRLVEGDLAERSMVVSNLGMHEIDAFIAIIDPPDPMILAVGRVADRCVPAGGVPAVRPMCTLTLSADHRAFDGIAGARFLGKIKRELESPFGLLEA